VVGEPATTCVTEGGSKGGKAIAIRERAARKNDTLGRIATVEDIALAAAFPASDDARWITGQAIVAAGGKRM
jgi:3-oxoacyl-[acyl-carrier protein] reductase